MSMLEGLLSKEVLQRRVFNPYYYDLHVKEFMLGQTKQHLDSEGSVIDVGAAVGQYSKFFALHTGHVYAYEAVPPVYEQLCKLKNEHLNFSPYDIAISDKVGEETFYVDSRRLSNSSFQNLVDGISITVKVSTIDKLHKDTNNICFIKIDTEGTELDVLNGAKKTIEKHKPHLMIEIYPKFNKYPVETSFKFCFDRGYSCFYNHKGKGLQSIRDVEHGKKVALTMPEITDGDFLFLNGDRT